MSTNSLVFVYGTLKSGFHNHYLLEKSEYLGDYKTPSLYTMYDLGAYPAVTTEGEISIYGEVYSVSSHSLSKLDELEGYPFLYDRITIETSFGNAWMYVLVVSLKHPIIENGLW